MLLEKYLGDFRGGVHECLYYASQQSIQEQLRHVSQNHKCQRVGGTKGNGIFHPSDNAAYMAK